MKIKHIISINKIFVLYCIILNLKIKSIEKIAMEGLRLSLPPGISSHMARLVKICSNEEPGKRPKFDMIIPILEKLKQK